MDTALIGLISLIVTSLTALGLAWIAFKQASLARNLELLEKNTNSIKDALVRSTAEKSHAEGKLEGKKEQAATDIQTAAIHAQGVLEGSQGIMDGSKQL